MCVPHSLFARRYNTVDVKNPAPLDLHVFGSDAQAHSPPWRSGEFACASNSRPPRCLQWCTAWGRGAASCALSLALFVKLPAVAGGALCGVDTTGVCLFNSPSETRPSTFIPFTPPPPLIRHRGGLNREGDSRPINGGGGVNGREVEGRVSDGDLNKTTPARPATAATA